MTARDLTPLIVDYLNEYTVGTVGEIAKGITARAADVRACLLRDPVTFRGPFTVGKAPHLRRVFLAPHSERDSLGRAA